MDKKLKALSPMLKKVKLSGEEDIVEYIEGLFDYEEEGIEDGMISSDYSESDLPIIKDWRKVIIQLVKDWKNSN